MSDDESKRVFERAVRMLAAKGRSVSDLRKHMIEKGEEPSHVDAAIATLVSKRLLDDAAYAQTRAKGSLSSRSRSTRRTAQELASKGVDPAVAKEAVARALDESGDDERSIAVRAAEKKLRSLAREAPDDRKRKLYAFLARQGFSVDSAKHAMKTVLEAKADVDE